VYDDVRNVRAVIVHQERDLGSTPEPDEIGRVIVMPPAEVTRLLELSEPVASLDAEPDLLANLESCAADNPELTLSELELLEILDSTLSERDRQIVSLRFGIGENREHTLEEVGRTLGVTRERVRQIQSAALDQIRPLVKDVLAAR
jgi:RNA polymerase primary sigma factor